MSYSKLASLTAVLALTACATAPTAPAPATVHELAPATAPATAVTPVSAAAPAAAPSADDVKHQALLKQARTMGFKPKLTNGVVMYCRNEAPIGTRFDQTVCHSEDAMADVVQAMQRQKDELDSAHSCAGAGCSRH